jgi:predicted Zn-dependent protease
MTFGRTTGRTGSIPSRAALVILAVGTGLVTCATNPATGERELALIPQSQEIEMGQSAASEVASTIGIYEDQAATSYVAEIGRALAAKSERPGLPWKFQIADEPVVNAFALPGGFIFVTRGLMTHLESEAQLASVIGHEIGHVTARHSVNQMSKASLAQLGLAVGMAVSDTVRSLGQIGAFGLKLLFLKYSRDDERQADQLGFRYMVEGGYDARAMPQVFATLERVSDASGGDPLPSWLATHPTPDSRVEHIEQLIAQGHPPAGVVDQRDYLGVVDGMVYGADPRQGYFDGETFKHPALRFRMQVPAGWKAQNLAQALVAEAPGGAAGFQMTLTGAASPAEALQGFGKNQGVSSATPIDLGATNLPSSSAQFRGHTDSGDVTGLVSFVAHAGKVFQLLGLAKAGQEASFDPAFRAIIGSFAPLTDAAARAVEPARIKVVTVPAAMTFAAFAAGHAGALSPAQLALLNQVTVDTRLAVGQRVKVVIGQVRHTEQNVAARSAGRAPRRPPVMARWLDRQPASSWVVGRAASR